MKLTEALVADACIVDLKARTKKEALREMAEALCRAVPALDAKELLRLLLEREALQSTAMGDGIAIPHARVEALDRVLASFGRSLRGVDFDSVDGKPTHLLFLLAAPGSAGSDHLRTLARLSRSLSKAEFRERLLEVDSVDGLFRAFQEEESKE
jgi:PTS system nitrogen regulatory IIA component